MAAAIKGFVCTYGDEPTGVWAAPGRVNLIGEHTDYNEGFALPYALPQRVVVAAAPADRSAPRRWTVWSAQVGDRISFTDAEIAPPRRVNGWGAYMAGVVWSLRSAGFDVPAARLAIVSDVPSGAGLSSSAALVSAVLSALIDLGELDVPLAARPSLAQRAEHYAGIPCGILDQTASIHCRAGHALFLDCRSAAMEHIPLNPAAAGLAVLVIDSRAPHQHTTGEYAARRATCLSAAAALGAPALRDLGIADLDAALPRLPDDVARRRVRHVVTENQRVLDVVAALRSDDLLGIGPLLTASHRSMRDDFEITVPEVDTAVAAALTAGAYGVRMTGGGFGGCILALVDADRVPAVAAAVIDVYDECDYRPPEFLLAAPAGGAERIG
ncbi:MAG TPA: galactokinase [Micromonospora sp.]|nr:galactokinase [Micromonospora sp.]